MEFRILGPIEISSGGRLLRLGGERQRALLAYLLLNANEAVPARRLLDELWDEPPGGGLAALQTQVSRLRRVIPGRIVTVGCGYSIRVDAGALDLARFRALVAASAASLDPGARAARLREAGALWRGVALDGLDAPFAAVEATALEELRLGAIEDRIEADLELGRHRELVPELSGLVARHPLRERLRGQLILALYRSGRQADALRAYRQAWTTLVGELGLEPGPALRELERSILRHDPALAPARPAAAEPRTTPRKRRRGSMFVVALVGLASAAGAAVALTAAGSHAR